jgi:hypothetical protein
VGGTVDETGVVKLCKRVLHCRLAQAGGEGEATDGDPHGYVASLVHIAMVLRAVEEGTVDGPAAVGG